MIREFYSIRDGKANTFYSPNLLDNEGVATRVFGDQVNKNDSQLHIHPEDYSLWRVGKFDTEKGVVIVVEPKCVANALDYIKKE